MQQIALATSETQLVRVFAGQIDGATVTVCDARELHGFLRNGDKFADWIKARIEKYDFEENQDFHSFSGKAEKPRSGRPSREYHLTLDMAKELSMVENNEQGRAARRYFIRMERKALEAAPTLLAPELPPLIAQRWITTFDRNGEQHTRLLPMDVCIMNVPRFIEHITCPQEMALERPEVFELTMKLMSILQQRYLNPSSTTA